ncbi:MAG: M20/M25/M40 family metallo-hydrolase [Gemmatimonadetes bacterium]|nr:M20/M25/M40 family metallo-hydrolase [Gemmatimonadota bacterium]
MAKRAALLSVFVLLLLPCTALAQGYPQRRQVNQFPVDDPVIKAIWDEGMDHSQIYNLAQTLADSIGPRLPGSPQFDAGAAWALKLFDSWGIEGRKDEYGTWKAWERGPTHVDLIAPRVRSLDGIMQAWSAGTNGPVTGEAVVVPPISSPAELDAFLETVKGKFVLLTIAEPTCRPAADWEEWATPASLEKMQALQAENRTRSRQRFEDIGLDQNETIRRFEAAGVAGILSGAWTGNWGATRVMAARNQVAPNIVMGCEDYGLVYRLAENGQGPMLRVDAQAKDLGTAPTYNIIGEIRGTELPDQYVILSAHFDSWDSGSGATDNNSGTVTMLEAARILRQAYPHPKRTILVGLWNGEEEGLNGSRAFVADHPDIVANVQALFNQDNGTGRVVNISMQGLTGVAGFMGEWMTAIPTQISQEIRLQIPGTPGTGGSDYSSFVCASVPAFSLSSLSWSYRQTYHNPTDTFDKVIIDDIMNNATLTAMLTYLASEEPERLPRDQRVMGINARTGEPGAWPQCRAPARNDSEYFIR